MLRIGASMLIFIAAFNVLSVLYEIFDVLIFLIFEEPVSVIVSEILYALVYSAAFLIPAVFLARLCKDDGVPLIKGVGLSFTTPLYIIVGIACSLVFAYINANLVSIFNYSDFSSELLWNEDYDAPYKIILQLITTAVVPGIFEEVLFRGVMLAKLRPYGKTAAILISAVMFALMHQNAEQFLYTLAAGIVLGFIAAETGSLLTCILVHFANNAFSVFEQALLSNGEGQNYITFNFVVELIIIICGVMCAIGLMVMYYRRRKNDFSDGVFQKELTLCTENGKKLSAASAVRLFFSPTVIIFIALSALNAVTMIFGSILFSLLT